MSINSIGGSTSGNFAAHATQRTSGATAVQKQGRDSDGDSDGTTAAPAKPASAPTVNLAGQTVGKLINVKA